MQATPEQIPFSATSTGDLKRLVMVRSGDGRAFDVLSAELQHAVGSVEFKKLAKGKWQVSLSVQPDSLAEGASIEIKTSIASQQTLSIPLKKP